ncbi:MAG: hypothetical protein N2320_06285 [Candidatus Bipolaricaulota bacterium]|nr:hypothetical protein [Candidatus Bipolaricaulota bacterium]
MRLRVLVLALGALALVGAAAPERLLLTGVPPLGPSWIARPDGGRDPAGCGPEAARLLLLYWDRRYGYRLVEDLDGAIAELHRRMGTITVTWEGIPQGLTWPWAFAPGLHGYIAARYGDATVGSFSGTLPAAFARSVELLLKGLPHVILFDWEGKGGILPTHYALVVGYDRSAGRRQLVLNPGWGYDFQLLDLADPAVAPVTLYWIEEIGDPPDGRPGRPSPRPVGAGMWERDEAGSLVLRPVLRLHFDPRSTVRWPPASRLLPLVPGAEDIVLALWDAP